MFRRVACLGVLTLSAAAPVLAQTADEIIEKHLAAVGGRATLSKLSSRVATGTIALTTPVGELKGTVEVYNKKPNKQRTLVKIDASAFGGTASTAPLAMSSIPSTETVTSRVNSWKR